jgi:hypothetical protein
MRDIDETFQRLGKSKFRSRFRLGVKERSYLEQKGVEEIIEHAHQFIQQRLAPAEPRNDGKQTPIRGHPVFIPMRRDGYLLPRLSGEVARN